MNNKFLFDLQQDIFDEKGYYILYAFVFIPTFAIAIEEIKLYFDIFRIILTGIALLLLVLIYLKCKNSRNEKEDKRIIHYTFFFLLLTLASIYNLIKHLN